jgi:hypothetical protein
MQTTARSWHLFVSLAVGPFGSSSWCRQPPAGQCSTAAVQGVVEQAVQCLHSTAAAAVHNQQQRLSAGRHIQLRVGARGGGGGNPRITVENF